MYIKLYDEKNEDRVRVGDSGIDQNQVTPAEMSGNRIVTMTGGN